MSMGLDVPWPLYGDVAGGGPRLLLISYHFPPGAAIGSLRWRKLAALAAGRGWALDAITADPAGLPARDDEGLRDLPVGTRVFGVPTPVLRWERLEDWLWVQPRRWLRSTRQVADSAAAPSLSRRESFARGEISWWPSSLRSVLRARDALGEYARDGRWARDAADLATRLARAVRYIACVTCGPPHMAHDAGRRLRTHTGLPHVMDLRDPWSLVERVPEGIASPVWFALARRHERRAVASAGLIAMNTKPAAAAMRGEYPRAAARIIAAPNGFDVEPVPTMPRGRAFVIAYAGSIYLDRDPRPLLQAAARVIREQRLAPDDLRVEFMGNVKSFEGHTLERIAEDEGIRPYVRTHPPASRRLALEFMARASLLVSLYQDSHWAIPGKVFEYMLFDAWLLALALPGSATADLLSGSGADIVRPEDVDAIASVLARRYAEHRAGVRPPRLADNQRFSRGTQAAVLFDAIGRLTKPPGR